MLLSYILLLHIINPMMFLYFTPSTVIYISLKTKKQTFIVTHTFIISCTLFLIKHLLLIPFEEIQDNAFFSSRICISFFFSFHYSPKIPKHSHIIL